MTSADELVAADRAFVVAPAGFGKTELIAQAIQLAPGKSLVLTHTHSGVNALRHRLRALGVHHRKFVVETIAGWALKYSGAYPALSGLEVASPTGAAWSQVYDAANQLLGRRAIRQILANSFTGVFVDEYQDCNLRQHPIVLALAEVLPCRLLGDPLQGIFDFAEPTVDWASDVVPNFDRLSDLTVPHRWRESNPRLGAWLGDTRQRLIAGEPISLGEAPLHWAESTPQNQRSACFQAAQNRSARVVAIRKWPNECHEFASSMSGLYTSMEELDCRALMDAADALDRASDGYEQAVALIDFASRCYTTIRGQLAALREKYDDSELVDTSRLTRNRPIAEALNRVCDAPSAKTIIDAARVFDRYPDARLYRRELWNEFKTTMLTFGSGGHKSLADTAWYVRDKARRHGRRSENRVVSRTLLVKGLEFDRSVVLDVGSLSAKEAYVAMTRGTRDLWVLSASDELHVHASRKHARIEAGIPCESRPENASGV